MSGETRVVFTEPGSLGLKLVEDAGTGGVHLMGTNAGTQADHHSGVLRPGRMNVSAIGGRSVAGMSYRDALGLIKGAGRPLEIAFVIVAPPQSPRSPRQSPRPEPTGRAAAVALQQHIATSGTSDVNTIDRLRRASLQPDRQGGGGASQAAATASAAELMAAAMAEVDDEEDDEEPQPEPASSSHPTKRRAKLKSCRSMLGVRRSGSIQSCMPA
jgi:molybdenum-dependent DNA-binding transcriptional regulator ModE